MHEKRPLLGVEWQNMGRYRSARLRKKCKHSWGTLEFVKEAFKGFNSNTHEYEELGMIKQGKESLIHVESSKETSCLMANVHSTKSSDHCDMVASDRKARRSLLGVRKQKNGRYGAVITDPIRHKKVWLATFDTAQEASKAYLVKQCEFARLAEVNGKRHLSKVQRLKSGRCRTLLRDPIKKKDVFLGNFDTAEDASKVDFSKKGKVEKLVMIKEGSISITCEESELESSAVATPAVTGNQSLNQTDGISNERSTSFVKRPLLGVEWQNMGRYNKKKRLDALESVEEPAKGFCSNMQETEKLVKVKQGKGPVIHEKSSRETTCSMDNVQGAKLSDGCDTPGDNPDARRSIIGVRRQKNGRYGAVITDPIRHKKVWIGTFDTVEEASQAYFSKKCEFEKLIQSKQGNKPKSYEQLQPESSDECNTVTSNPKAKRSLLGVRRQKNGRYGVEPESFRGALSPLANDQSLNTVGLSRSGRSNSPETSHFIGVRKRNSGNYASEIRNPISKKRIWLGTYGTAEEASQAYQSKKLEFQKLLKVKQQCNKQISRAREIQDGKRKLVNVKLGHETVNHEEFQFESAGGASSLEIDVPISNLSDGGSDQGIDFHEISHSMGVQKRKSGKYTYEITNRISMTKMSLGSVSPTEEAFHVEQSKKFEFQSSKNVELQSNPTDSSAGEKQAGQEDEDLWMGRWVQLPGDRAVKFSLQLGLPIIDNYGSLLERFSQEEGVGEEGCC
uniref:Uncharacterized protein isoform X1 n=1 Tax=Nicotiana tabacum TaxID=4097 RepID=A0A1S4AIK1_TOBAC|nr:PREDICTED: uncharacterized protein LOC107798048 isoform X1 [Nicotiana tabacum]XP_016476468.1 PREDICTED: uncharacterized protein LOC107798048 isoform X1 [Nicotiana tabacum]XP_016476469.1 PREDICTED: uncharacterized protein LOC107798048 isoform X1 [Nicotiana tabacum]XP_016476471.1 PREDICTED: uncharacterized protein LOC107798048 isoform X1 [Nicotiana tabacum]